MKTKRLPSEAHRPMAQTSIQFPEIRFGPGIQRFVKLKQRIKTSGNLAGRRPQRKKDSDVALKELSSQVVEIMTLTGFCLGITGICLLALSL